MSKLALFLMESSMVLIALYTVYYLLLRKEGSFNFNRCYLLVIVVFSLIFPLLSYDLNPVEGGPLERPLTEINDVRKSYHGAVEFWIDQPISLPSDTPGVVEGKEKRNPVSIFFSALITIYIIGAVVILSRMVWMLSWILKLRSASPKEITDGTTVIKVPYKIAPFSFLNSVFVYEELLKEDEFLSHP